MKMQPYSRQNAEIYPALPRAVQGCKAAMWQNQTAHLVGIK
jgi:hypothetical protein